MVRNQNPSAVLTVGALLALAASLQPATPARAQDTSAEPAARLAADDLPRDEWTRLALLALEGESFQPPACTPGDRDGQRTAALRLADPLRGMRSELETSVAPLPLNGLDGKVSCVQIER